ncbi:MAG: GNAT family N-acetyltransferase [Candidatus Hodarchaeota archaeon]
MQIRVQTWDEVEKKTLARYLFETRQEEGLLSDSTALDGFTDYLEWLAQRSHSIPIVAYSKNQVVGWLAFFSFIPNVGTIGRWHPIVKLGPHREAIAEELLKATIKHAQSQGFDRLEAELTEITPQTELRALLYQRWLENQGMHLTTEEARLERKLTRASVPPVHLPAKFELVPLPEYTNEELRGPFFEMFDNSIDRFWLDQTVEQRLDSYKFWLDRERPFIEQATGVLVKTKEIVGVTVVRPIREVGMLGPIGVVPQHRRQGLGRGLLAFSMQGVLASGFSVVQLEFDITNKPALALYKAMGFQHVHRLRIFALTF